MGCDDNIANRYADSNLEERAGVLAARRGEDETREDVREATGQEAYDTIVQLLEGARRGVSPAPATVAALGRAVGIGRAAGAGHGGVHRHWNWSSS